VNEREYFRFKAVSQVREAALAACLPLENSSHKLDVKEEP
jgi:hypothetical protein